MAIRCLRVTVPELLEENICRLYLHIWKEKTWFPNKIFPECFLVMSAASLIYDKGDGQRFHPPECSHDCTSFGLKYGSKHKVQLSMDYIIRYGIFRLKYGTSSIYLICFSFYDTCAPKGINPCVDSHGRDDHIRSLVINVHFCHYNSWNCGWFSQNKIPWSSHWVHIELDDSSDSTCAIYHILFIFL